MKKKWFNKVLEQVENGTFVGDTLEISGIGEEEDSRSPYALTNDDAIVLANALKNNPNITTIKLQCNLIGDMGAIALANVETLKNIGLGYNEIRAIGATALANSNLKSLGLESNFITYNNTSKEIFELTNVFCNNKTIVNLQLYNCGIPDEMIAEIINKNTVIKYLNVSENELTDKALVYISNNITLENLILYGNPNITDRGIEYVSQNSSLIHLGLGSNSNVTYYSGELLAIHPTLQTFTVNSDHFTIDELKDIFIINPSYKSIDHQQDIELCGNIDYNIDDSF